jgi:hypothetical protein
MNKRDQGRADKRAAKLEQKSEDEKTIRATVSKYNPSDLNLDKSSGKATSLVSYKRTTEVVK